MICTYRYIYIHLYTGPPILALYTPRSSVGYANQVLDTLDQVLDTLDQVLDTLDQVLGKFREGALEARDQQVLLVQRVLHAKAC